MMIKFHKEEFYDDDTMTLSLMKSLQFMQELYQLCSECCCAIKG